MTSHKDEAMESARSESRRHNDIYREKERQYRKIKDSYYCTKCGNNHYEFGKIGQKHIEYKGKIQTKKGE